MNLARPALLRFNAATLPLAQVSLCFSGQALAVKDDNKQLVPVPKTLRPSRFDKLMENCQELWVVTKELFFPSESKVPKPPHIEQSRPKALNEKFVLDNPYFGPKIGLTGRELLAALRELMYQKIGTNAYLSYQDKLDWANANWDKSELAYMLQGSLAVLDRDGEISKAFVKDAIDTDLIEPCNGRFYQTYRLSNTAQKAIRNFWDQEQALQAKNENYTPGQLLPMSQDPKPGSLHTPMLDKIQEISAQLVFATKYFEFNGQEITGETLWRALWEETEGTERHPLESCIQDAAKALEGKIPTGKLFQEERDAFYHALLRDFGTAGLVNLVNASDLSLHSLPETGYQQIREKMLQEPPLPGSALQQIDAYLIGKCLQHVYVEYHAGGGGKNRITGLMLLKAYAATTEDDSIQNLLKKLHPTLSSKDYSTIKQALIDLEQLGLVSLQHRNKVFQGWNESVNDLGLPLPTVQSNALSLTDKGQKYLEQWAAGCKKK